jgi:beta-lactamase class A
MLTFILYYMIRAMDGVRLGPLRRQPIQLAPVARAIPAQPMPAINRAGLGMDGVRRPQLRQPREMLPNMFDDSNVIVTANAATQARTPIWGMPSLRLPAIGWRRPAIAFGLVATALIASSALVHSASLTQTATARAASQQARILKPSPAPAQAVAAATPAPTPQKTGLQQLLTNFAAANPDKYSIVVKDMTTGDVASINPDKQLESASLYKLFVAQRIYQRIDLGQLDYGTPAGGGSGLNVQDCLTIMINISDNTCGRALGSILGWNAQDQALSIEGYKATSLATPQSTSATDVATLLSRLYSGTLVSGNSSTKFLNLLESQHVNNRLPQGLPAGTVIAHKTGDLDGVVHDTGIVYGPKTNYLVVVLSGPWDAPGNVPSQFADLSTQLWNYFEN